MYNRDMVFITKNCLYCGNPFQTTRGKINAGRGKYCSSEHYYLHKAILGKENSKYGKENASAFWSNADGRWKVAWRTKDGKYHSLYYSTWWWEQNVGDIPDGYVIVHRDGDYENISEDNFECITFSENQKRIHVDYERTEEFKHKMSIIKTGTKMSDEQRVKTSDQTRKNWALGIFDKIHKGENSYRWRGGQGNNYPKEFYNIREFVVERDNETCQVCGHKPERRKFGHVHHRDGNRENNDQDNLIYLCVTCHGKVHSKSKENDLIMALRSELLWLD